MKPKLNRKDKTGNLDRCQTPAYALDPILPYLKRNSIIWEPAAGKGNLVRILTELGHTVISGDILTGQDFFKYQPKYFDYLITNPPYSIKYRWLHRCYLLGKPFALLVPIETTGTATTQKLYDQYGYEWVFMNKRINFDMPHKGQNGGGAQFPTFWTTWGLGIGQPVIFTKIQPRPDEQLLLMPAALLSESFYVKQLQLEVNQC